MSNPERGEVWLVDLGYVTKVRPCLVISIPALEQDRALATLATREGSPALYRFDEWRDESTVETKSVNSEQFR